MKRIGCILLLSVLSLTLFSQIHWTKYAGNPVMAPTEEWEGEHTFPCSVIYSDSLYRMWYWSGIIYNKEGIGYASSPDGITWTKYINNPVLEAGSEGTWDDHIIHSCYVILVDSVFHMWYSGHTGSNINRNYRIGHATSTDGITWTKESNNPVLIEGKAGDWDELFVIASSVIHDGDNYHMWYEGAGQCSYGWCMRAGHAISPDGVNWEKDTLNPVLSPEYSWEGNAVPGTMVLFNGFDYKMWYSGNHNNPQVGYATSFDGSVWKKYEHNPIFDKGSAGSWEQKGVAFGAIIDSAGKKLKVWYGGWSEDDFNAKVGYAETYEPAWKQMASMNEAKGGSESCAFDSMIYIFGGADNSGIIVNTTEAYNPETNIWTTLSSAPVNFVEAGAGVVNDKIYISGGYTLSDQLFSNASTYEYDPELDNWETKKDCPKGNAAPASCVLDDKLYFFGGLKDWPENDISGQEDALVYDPATDTWDSIPRMLNERAFGATSCVYNGQIYIFGGFMFESLYSGTPEGTQVVGKTESYDPNENNWTELADMPVPVVFPLSLVYKDRIYLFGGDSTYSRQYTVCTNIIQEYDPSTNNWRRMENMPFSRSDMAGETVANNLYLFGGYPYDAQVLSSALPEVWRFNLDSLKPYSHTTSVRLDKESLELTVGETWQLIATVLPQDASDPSISWNSADQGIASVDHDGMVEGKGVGMTEIYVTTVDGQFKDTCQVTVIQGVGIDKTNMNQWLIFPNPTNDALTIETNTPGQYFIEITSMNGQQIQSTRLDGPINQLDLSSFQPGVYFITIRSKDIVITRKIIKL